MIKTKMAAIRHTKQAIPFVDTMVIKGTLEYSSHDELVFGIADVIDSETAPACIETKKTMGAKRGRGDYIS